MTNIFHDENSARKIDTSSVLFLKDVLNLIDNSNNNKLSFKSANVHDRYEFAACIEQLINTKKNS